MGKMKEIYMQMLEKQLNNYETLLSMPPEPVETDILCPNCNKGKLQFIAVNDIVCYESGCGHTFVLVDAETVKFK